MNNNPMQLFGPDYLDIAGQILERTECRDNASPTLLEITGVSQHGMATASGLNDYDYQNLSSLSLGQKQLYQVTTVNKVPIPSEILDHFKHIKCHCMMGLFPEIGRAWLTIDSEIYIWTYEHARDVAYYDGLNHLIVSVGLIKPKTGVFIKDVQYLLILTTPTDIVVLGITFGDTTKTISSPSRVKQGTAIYEEMQLMNKPIFVLNTDNISISVIKGTSCGRIFLGGRDGCLYEIDYHAESSWLGKRCKKINHSQSFISSIVPNFLKLFAETESIVDIVIDNSRKLLYTLTNKGSIEAWFMGTDSNAMTRLSRVSQREITSNASNIIKTIDPSIFQPITSLCPLTNDDCPGLNLIAVTQSGVRLYFSTTTLHVVPLHQQQQGIQIVDAKKPNGLYLLHVRLPPGYTPNTTINKPKQVHSAYYSDGTLLLICTPQQDQDILWSISSAPFPNRPYLAESPTILPLDGVVWNVAEVKEKNLTTINSAVRNAQRPKKVVLLTNQGAQIIALLKPADILQQLLVACHGPHNEAIKAFFKAQTEREACSTSLILACSDTYRGTDVALWAAQAFMVYGGEPSFQISQMLPQRNMTMLQSSSPERNPQQMFMSTPMTNIRPNLSQQTLLQQTQYPPSPISNTSMTEFTNIMFSAKHDGLYLYVIRLLHPIWKQSCITKNFCSTITQQDCVIILDDLLAVNRFLTENSVYEISGFMHTICNQETVFSTLGQINMQSSNLLAEQRNSIEQAQAEEKKSLMALSYFIKHACEVLSLWKILCEHKFQTLICQLTKEQQNILISSTFRDLMVSRLDICAVLIVELINSYLNDNASVSSISAKLRDVCPNLYRHEDAVSFKATEIIMLSKTCQNQQEKEERLRTALQLCKDGAPKLPIQHICQQFTICGFYTGVIELTTTCAAKIDPEELALHYYQNNEPAEDREGYAAFAARMNCYKEVKSMLDTVYQNLCNANENVDFQQNPNTNILKNLSTEIMKTVSFAVQMTDPLLHAIVYEWLLEHNLLSELLQLSVVSLGEFLRRSITRNPENIQLTELLWKYYEKNGKHAAAAKILDNLASIDNSNLPLEQRIEYLARAVMCMRNDNIGYSMQNGTLLKDLEDKLEIARVQKVILNAIDAINIPEANEASNRLNRTLYDMTTLYSDYAEPFELWECKLTILNCSHHNDTLLIESVWGQILNKCMEEPGLSPQEIMTVLLSKVQLLSKEFGDSGNCFPLAFIVHELEVKCCQLKLYEGSVSEALIGMKLDIEQLLDYYGGMLSMNERTWANLGNEWHLVKSTTQLISMIASTASQLPARNKRRILAKSQDLISACLNVCYQKPGTDGLTQDLREIQSRIQRAF